MNHEYYYCPRFASMKTISEAYSCIFQRDPDYCFVGHESELIKKCSILSEIEEEKNFIEDSLKTQRENWIKIKKDEIKVF